MTVAPGSRRRGRRPRRRARARAPASRTPGRGSPRSPARGRAPPVRPVRLRAVGRPRSRRSGSRRDQSEHVGDRRGVDRHARRGDLAAVLGAERPLRVLQAVAGDRDDDLRALRDDAGVGTLEQSGDADGRRGLDEDADLGRQDLVRGEDACVSDRAEVAVASRRGPRARTATTPGCRCGSPTRWSRGA